MNHLCTAAAGERLPSRMDDAVGLAAQRAVAVACPWSRVQQDPVRVQIKEYWGSTGSAGALPCPASQGTRR